MKFIYGNHANSGGIYQIKNLSNGRIYIGSAAKFSARWSQHKKDLLSGKHGNKFLQNDFNKCGTDVFEFSVLEVVDGDKRARQKVEQRFIDQHFDNQVLCYNLKKQANVSRKDIPSKNPEETKRLISEASKRAWQDPEYIERMKASRSTPEFKEKRSEAAKKWSNENREFLSVAAKESWEKLAQDPEWLEQYKKNASEHAKKLHSNPDTKKKILDSHSSPEVKKVMSDKAKARMADPEFKQNIIDKVTKRHATDPEYRAKNLQGLKNAREALKSPEAQEKLRLATIERVAKQKANAKTVTLIDPEGNVVVIQNLNDWCREKGFSSSRFYCMIKGQVASAKGYKLYQQNP